MCFGKMLLPFCNACVTPACSRERKKEREGEGGRTQKPPCLEGDVLQTRWPWGWSSRGSGSAALPGAGRAGVHLHFPSEAPVSWGVTAEPLPVPSATRFPRGHEMKRAHTQSTALPSARICHWWAPKAAAAREL